MEIPIYLDYNATTPLDAEVFAEMAPFLQHRFGNPSSPYALGLESKRAIDRARGQVAELIHARPDEIVFTGSATEANNLAILGAARANHHRGNHIITSAVEHPAVKEVCRHLSQHGFEVTTIPVDSSGRVDPQVVENAIGPKTILISIMHANNEVGTIQPIEAIGDIAKKHQVLYHTDAAQSAGKIEVDVEKLNVDLLTLAGHKLYAPKGIGALYIRQGTPIENILFGAGQENGLRPGTENVPYIVALGKACELAKTGLAKNQAHLKHMRDRLLKSLLEKLGPAIKLNTDLENCLPNTLSVAFEKVEAHTLALLISNEVAISTGSACHAHSVEISYVLKAMNIDRMTAARTVRISTGKYTTKEEIDLVVDVISSAVNQFL
ncbi:MAG: cysteine desulfurase family protein [Mangrovibacterium sp.]